MALESGTYSLGPQNARLSVRTGRRGAIAKVGHDLLIEVGTWSATIQAGSEPQQMTLQLTADSGSLKVRQGTGGAKSLDADDMANIDQTITDEVLKGTRIAFHSRSVRAADPGRLSVEGDLELAGQTKPITFELALGEDGHLTGSAIVKQTTWGMKPYTALFGTLKVADEVEVLIDGRLSAGSSIPQSR